MTELRVEKLIFKVHESYILNELSTSFKTNSLTCILGPNGAGKTSLIKCIANLIKFEGDILINGQSISEFRPDELARKVSYVPQSISADLNFSVEDFVMFSRYPWQGISEYKKEKLEETLLLTGMQDHKKQLMKTLSGGERQRALIAAALVQETDIILLDEISSALDPKYQDQIVQMLLKIRDTGKTLIWATHDINAALLHGDYLLALKKGRIFGEGSPAEFLEKNVLQELYERQFEKVVHTKYHKEVLI